MAGTRSLNDAEQSADIVCVQRQLFARSERVKGIDFHPTEPWVCRIVSMADKTML